MRWMAGLVLDVWILSVSFWGLTCIGHTAQDRATTTARDHLSATTYPDGPGSAPPPGKTEDPSGQAIEDPSGQALAPFFKALDQVKMREPGTRAVIVQLGDSHTAADFLTAEVRRGLQRILGDAGRGFLFAGQPFKYYYQRDVIHGSSGVWMAQNGLLGNAIEPLGLGGTRVSSSSPTATVYVETCGKCETNGRASAFEIYFWCRPGGGSFVVKLDGQEAHVVGTGTDQCTESLGSTGYFRVPVPDGPHRLELHPQGGGPVDLFGIVMERDEPGVSYDALGLLGAWAGTPLQWTWQLAGEQLAHRNPSLVVTWYGTNESSRAGFDISTYDIVYRQLLRQLKTYAPEAACLVIGPPDYAMRSGSYISKKNKKNSKQMRYQWRPPPMLQKIIEIQRDAAFECGCAFWDTRRAMGGPGSIDRWVRTTPPLAQNDRVHLTKEGYERLGRALLANLLKEYERYTSSTTGN